MRNWQRWALAMLLALVFGGLEATVEPKADWIDAMRHGAFAMFPSLIALKMTLNPDEK